MKNTEVIIEVNEIKDKDYEAGKLIGKLIVEGRISTEEAMILLKV